jgi:hypothetical protein
MGAVAELFAEIMVGKSGNKSNNSLAFFTYLTLCGQLADYFRLPDAPMRAAMSQFSAAWKAC